MQSSLTVPPIQKNCLIRLLNVLAAKIYAENAVSLAANPKIRPYTPSTWIRGKTGNAG